MKIAHTFAALALVGSVAAGCTTAEQTGVVGAGAGALIGGATTGTAQGALAGAAIGGATGYVIGKLADGRCRYRYPDGRVYIAACP